LARLLLPLVEGPATREYIQSRLRPWHAPEAAQQIAETILEAIMERRLAAIREPMSAGSAELKQQTSVIS